LLCPAVRRCTGTRSDVRRKPIKLKKISDHDRGRAKKKKKSCEQPSNGESRIKGMSEHRAQGGLRKRIKNQGKKLCLGEQSSAAGSRVRTSATTRITGVRKQQNGLRSQPLGRREHAGSKALGAWRARKAAGITEISSRKYNNTEGAEKYGKKKRSGKKNPNCGAVNGSSTRKCREKLDPPGGRAQIKPR